MPPLRYGTHLDRRDILLKIILKFDSTFSPAPNNCGDTSLDPPSWGPVRAGQLLSFITVTGLQSPGLGDPARYLSPTSLAIYRLRVPRFACRLLRWIPGWFVVVVVVTKGTSAGSSYTHLWRSPKPYNNFNKKEILHWRLQTLFRAELWGWCAWRQAPKPWQSVNLNRPFWNVQTESSN